MKLRDNIPDLADSGEPVMESFYKRSPRHILTAVRADIELFP